LFWKRAKIHLRASAVPKIFFGWLALAMKRKTGKEEDREGERDGRGGEGREKERRGKREGRRERRQGS
jgi:hypothetical protein